MKQEIYINKMGKTKLNKKNINKIGKSEVKPEK